MTAKKSLLPGDTNEEVSSLIATLNEAQHRLEVLTEGEVDTVADLDGRTFLLRRAQEQLRHSEAAKQAAILNALPANIALLDTRGVIVSVNEAWRQFAGANVLQGPGYGIGVNYLDVCDQARGDDSSEAHQVAEGIRSVVDGRANSFSIEYPCHSRAEQRWFLMTVTPLADDRPNGAVVMHLDITERKRGEDDLRRFAAAMDAISDAVLLIDRASMRFVHVNDAACRHMNRTREQLLALDPWTSASMSRTELEQVYDAAIASGADPKPQEMPFPRKDGSISWVEVRRHALRSRDDWIIVTLIRDITDRKRAAQDLHDSEARFRSLTALSSDWFWEQDAEHRFVAFSGGEGVKGWGPDQLKAVGVRRWELPAIVPLAGDWSAHKALLDARKPFRNFEYRRILGDGSRQYIAASGEPLFDADGRFTGYRGVATDITERKRVEDELQRFRAAMDSSGDAIVLVERISMRYVDVNQTLCEMVGYTRQEILGMTPMQLFGADRKILEHDYDAIIADNNSSASIVEGQYRHKDGSLIPIETRRRALHTDEGWIIVGTARDITERKQADLELQRFRAAMDISADAIVLVDRASMRYIDVNQTLCDMTGRTRQELIGLTPMDLMSENRETLERDYDAIIADGNNPAAKVEAEYRRADGLMIQTETRRRALRTENGWVLVGTVRDITAQKEAEARIFRLNRVYAVLSGINTVIVRVRDRDELFREACQIAVEHGKFKMAWIGGVDRSAMKVVPIASAGAEPEFLALVKDRFSLREDAPLGNTRTARAVREKKAIVVNKMQDEGEPLFFAKERLERGISSMAILPLLVSDEAVGVLALYAGEAGFFDEEEMKLLTELAGDIAFAVDHIEKQDRLNFLAYYDPLTGLANRTLFLERLTQHIRSAVNGGHKLALFFLDLERFRNINDSLGRPAGDALLTQVSKWLMQDAGDASLLARIGADHFAIVLPELKQPGDIARLLDKRIQAFLNHPFRLKETELRLSVKVGVAVFPNDGTDADTLLKNAEAALKKAKRRGERYVFYKQKMTERVAGNLTLENQLREALDKGEFALYYQPKVNLVSGLLTGAEALIRWNDPRTGLVPPGRFIPILEETGLINEVGRWALRQAVADYLRWRNAGLPAVRIAVNVSPLQLRGRNFTEEIKRVLGVDAHAAEGLELEITESLIMEDVKHSIATLKEIRAMGVTIAIDDFGTGFSSLSYLAKLPVNTLKIDRSFVIDMTNGPEGLALVSTIISLAHSLRLKVVAEGVETEEQSRILHLLRCDEMQGYLFSKPVPAEIFEAKFLARPAAG